MDAGDAKDSPGGVTHTRKQPIDDVTATDSVVALLSELNTEKFSREERLAVNRLQSSALALRLNWLSEYCRTIANRNSEPQDRNAAGASATESDLLPTERGPRRLWNRALAGIAAGKTRLGLS